jgi:glutathione peroxidase
MNTTAIYNFEAARLNGKTISLDEYEGKAIVVVNTASKCGLTPQYEGLEKLYQEYKDRGLVVLGFPCNQFGNQESGTADEIEEFCQINYGVSFPVFDKVEVNGDGAHPLFKYLKSELPGDSGSGAIEWNFTKFFIDKEGTPIKRFAPTTPPKDMVRHIENVL